MKKVLSVMLSVLMLSCMLVLCSQVSIAEGITYSTENATILTFGESEITTVQKGSGKFEAEGTALSIKKEGTYIVSGSCSDGSIVVKKGTTDVILVLAGLTLESKTTAPLTCNKSSSATIVAAEGTVNTLTDNVQNNDDVYTDNSDAENAVIKCKDGSKITLDGTGTLNINSNGKNGIKSGCTTEDEGEAYLKIRNLTLNITATVNDGINAEQLLEIESGNITVDANDDGIHCDLVMNIGKTGEDTSPVIDVKNSYEGIEAATLNIYGGDISVHSSDDGMNAANSDLTDYDFSLNIAGGKVYVNAEDGDGIDSNGTLTISGGNVMVFSSARGDNAPLDSDKKLTISGGTVLAVGNSRMAQTPQNSQAYVEFGSSSLGGGMYGGPRGGFGGDDSTYTINAGDTIAIKNSDGETLIEAVSPRNANYVLYSAAGVSADNTSLYVNGQISEGSNGSSSSFLSKIISFFNKIFDFFKRIFHISK